MAPPFFEGGVAGPTTGQLDEPTDDAPFRRTFQKL